MFVAFPFAYLFNWLFIVNKSIFYLLFMSFLISEYKMTHMYLYCFCLFGIMEQENYLHSTYMVKKILLPYWITDYSIYVSFFLELFKLIVSLHDESFQGREKWVNLHDCFTPLDKGLTKSSGGFIWASEKSGFKHLYLHDANGTCLGPITEGEWMVEQIAGVNEAAGLLYFTGTLDGPLESHLYCTKLFTNGSQPL